METLVTIVGKENIKYTKIEGVEKTLEMARDITNFIEDESDDKLESIINKLGKLKIAKSDRKLKRDIKYIDGYMLLDIVGIDEEYIDDQIYINIGTLCVSNDSERHFLLNQFNEKIKFALSKKNWIMEDLK